MDINNKWVNWIRFCNDRMIWNKNGDGHFIMKLATKFELGVPCFPVWTFGNKYEVKGSRYIYCMPDTWRSMSYPRIKIICKGGAACCVTNIICVITTQSQSTLCFYIVLLQHKYDPGMNWVMPKSTMNWLDWWSMKYVKGSEG